jgi:protein-S-isoprenylcysteine O-methyltransferase Ste14
MDSPDQLAALPSLNPTGTRMNAPDQPPAKRYQYASDALRLNIKSGMGSTDGAALDAPSTDNAGVMIRPVRWYVGIWILTLLLTWLAPWPLLEHPVPVWIGALMRVGGIAFGLWGLYTMHKLKTNICPRKCTKSITAKGPFRISRNPVYFGFSFAMIGVVFVWNTAWGVLTLVPLLLVMHFGVVLREERYLEQKFGDEYREYCAKVRRYL